MEFTSVDTRVALLQLGFWLWFTFFLESLEWVLEGASTGDDIVVVWDFNAHMGYDSNTWKSVTGRNDPPMDFYASQSLSITNTTFSNKSVYKCTCYQDTLGQQSMIDFVDVSSNLQTHVLR